MPEIVIVVLILLWFAGILTGHTLGGYVHVLLVIAFVLFIIGLVSGRPRIN